MEPQEPDEEPFEDAQEELDAGITVERADGSIRVSSPGPVTVDVSIGVPPRAPRRQQVVLSLALKQCMGGVSAQGRHYAGSHPAASALSAAQKVTCSELHTRAVHHAP